MNKLTVKDIDLKGKKVIMRADFNVPLDDQLIDRIRQWIENGAPDIFGATPELPNTSVRFLFFVAIDQELDSVYSDNRIDEFGSFVLPRKRRRRCIRSARRCSIPLYDPGCHRIFAAI